MGPKISIDRKIWGIAWPAILSNISIPLLGLVDAAILGHLGSPHYLGAVAIGSALLSFLYWGFGFLRMGTTGLVARAMGAGEPARAHLVLAQSALLALGLALLVWLSHPLLLGLGFTLMAPAGDVRPLAESYAGIRIASAPAVLVTYAVVGWCIGRQDTRRPLLIVVTTNATNIALDFALILGLGMNSDGAALATVIAEYLGCALALALVWRVQPGLPGGELRRQLWRWSAYRVLLRSNRHLFVRTVCLLGGFAFFTAAGDKLGTEVLAANALMMQLLLFAAYAMDGFAFAAEGLAGQLLGAGDEAGFYRAVARCGFWCALTALLISALFLVAREPLFGLLTDQANLLVLMREHAPWLVLMPLAAGASYLLDGVFVGSAQTRQMMVTMLVSAALVYLPAWYLSRDWGNHGLWFAFLLFNAARGLTLYWCYRRIQRRGGWLAEQP
ncbi:MATE family efflux transporter [Parahaliea mediterranea]|uniref:MATE family efflux transporter n=1 Tax=Parahaliea mediterranea TaxID=651086 RepID=A0A939DF61_9GAMM|nr:MATE family efflux transporter [Parahaliea mediterranea]MBN7797108.1 MATE family efflux transporter [Parahaliea mediterranea]